MSVQILDGAMGTELIARGVALEGPAWSARANVEAADEVASVHREYAEAGATLHTTNTFRTQPRAYGAEWRTALDAAVRLARQSVPDDHVVIGSMAPVEDCYEPDRSPGEQARGEHRLVARALADAGCDLLLCETFATEVEARVAVEEALQTGLPVWLSLTAGPFGELLTPVELQAIAMRLAPIGIERVMVNCIGATRIAPYVRGVANLGVPFGVYANAGGKEEGLGWDVTSDAAGAAYAKLGLQWVDEGASVVGGCCGTGPAHSRALVDALT